MQKNYTFQLIILLIFMSLSAFGQQLDMTKLKGLKFRSLGPAGMSGRVTSVDVVLKNPDIIYAGTASGGIWKSENGGFSWTPIFDTLQVASIGALAINQNNPSVIWAGTGEGNPRNSQTSGAGIYRSLDGGRSWKLMGLEKTRNIHRVILHPTNPDIIYVGAIGSAWGNHPERGVFKTTNGGKTWKKILYIDDKTGVADMVIDPENPNKLIVAMWEYGRKPWFFTSGGKNSGLYVSFDGGENWTERNVEDGMPKGDLGRIGLAIAPSNPKVIYALVEAKKNVLLKSEDGGFKFHKVNDKNEIGNRPFYYADIYVNPKNENEIYSLYSLVSKSIDGGKSFKVILPYSGVHPDHHAWWIHPENPNFMIDGNDGGLNITKDGGKTWFFAKNLPLAQFYHINVDNDFPYHIYGGMQDNGSWKGTSCVLKEGGIKNHHWQEVMFGDGFDVVPDPDNSRYGYAMYQGGNLARYDSETGDVDYIQPRHSEGKKLRFNWNAAIAQDPFDNKTIYYGSQFVHQSTDKGLSWKIISPDLTTNNPEKQKQDESGGLTPDVTDAENHTTILTIAPSSKKQGVIWVGTDDGNIQLTQDNGKTWQNLTPNLKGVPSTSRVPQIHASRHNEGEAFVVINNYQRNDWTPHLFQTKDFGKTWKRLIKPNQVWGYVLSFEQDPIEPKLMFLGTEFGLYVSIDAGENWTKWTNNYPTVSTMDMKIQEREQDLVIGTFGRAVYVLDDLRPLRTLAQSGTKILNQEIYAFENREAYLFQIQPTEGIRFPANAEFQGTNRHFGAVISYAVKEGKKEKDKRKGKEEKADSKEDKSNSSFGKVKVQILNSKDDTIRTFWHTPQTGINRVVWNLDKKRPRFPNEKKDNFKDTEPAGFRVVPDTYKVRLSYDGKTDSTKIVVKADPRLSISEADWQAREKAIQQVMKVAQKATKAIDQLNQIQKTVDIILGQMQENESDTLWINEVKNQSKTVKDSVKVLKTLILPKEDAKGYAPTAHLLNTKIQMLAYRLSTTFNTPHSTRKLEVELLQKEAKKVFERINYFYMHEYKKFEEAVNHIQLSPFKKIESLE